MKTYECLRFIAVQEAYRSLPGIDCISFGLIACQVAAIGTCLAATVGTFQAVVVGTFLAVAVGSCQVVVIADTFRANVADTCQVVSTVVDTATGTVVAEPSY